MKEVIFYVLVAFNSGHTEAVWTFSGLMSKSQCESLKQHVTGSAKEISWTERARPAPRSMECVEVGPVE